MQIRSLASSLGFSLLLGFALAACGGDDGNSAGKCGDGHVTGSETCDDGNTSNGDGCSSSCKVETSCGNGIVEVSSETCDDGNTASGDGCSSTCQTESGTCGNGTIEGTEQCDDGNSAANDGCGQGCMIESGYTCTGMPSVCTNGHSSANTCAMPGVVTLTAMGTDLVGMASGDTTSSMNQIPQASCDGIDSGDGNDQIWKFTTTDVRDVLVALTPDSTFDANVRVMSAACDATMGVADQLGADGCSDTGIDGEAEYVGFVNLPAGTYYVAVDGYDATYAGSYSLQITASVPSCGDGHLGNVELCDDGNMTDNDGCTHCTVDTGYNCDQSEPSVCQAIGCGDGLIQSGEDCDDDNTADNDGCSSTCTIEAGWSCTDGEPSVCSMIACGNGIVETGEECDDGNLTSGDRCSSTCVLEQDYTEANETTNNTTPEALTAGSHIIRGAFATGDVDLYTFTLTSTSKVEIETYSTINGTATDYAGVGNSLFDCPTTLTDTKVAVFPPSADVTMDAMASAIDDDDGDLFCSYLGVHDGPDSPGTDPMQLAALPAGTYTIRVTPSQLATTIPAGTRYMLDLKITGMGTGPVKPAAGDLKINEFLAADGGSTNGGVDSNCDGALTNSDDEFLELVNVSNKTLDLTGVTYADAIGVKFTFSAQTTGSLTLAPNKAVVVWGGGAPACPGVTNFFVNGTAHTLSLNDGGDTITIATGGTTPVTIATTTYGAATIGISSNLSPDVTGTAYAAHNTITGHVGSYSPGKKNNGTAF